MSLLLGKVPGSVFLCFRAFAVDTSGSSLDIARQQYLLQPLGATTNNKVSLENQRGRHCRHWSRLPPARVFGRISSFLLRAPFISSVRSFNRAFLALWQPQSERLQQNTVNARVVTNNTPSTDYISPTWDSSTICLAQARLRLLEASLERPHKAAHPLLEAGSSAPRNHHNQQ